MAKNSLFNISGIILERIGSLAGLLGRGEIGCRRRMNRVGGLVFAEHSRLACAKLARREAPWPLERKRDRQ